MKRIKSNSLISPITVAVVDTGISPGELESAVVLPGVNLSGEGARYDSADVGTHGTDVAKIIFAIAPNTKLVPVRLMNSRGSLQGRQKVEAAFDWILEQAEALEIRLVCVAFANFSQAVSDADYRGSPLQQKIIALKRRNIATVAAAGNWHRELSGRLPQGMAWPAIIKETISVGEAEWRDGGWRVADCSQRLHPSVGGGCFTTMFAPSGQLGSTSGAAAHVAGAITALLQSPQPFKNRKELIDCLLKERQLAFDDNGLSWPFVNCKGPLQ